MAKTRKRLEIGLTDRLEITSLKMLFCYRNTAEKNKTRNNNLKKNIWVHAQATIQLSDPLPSACLLVSVPLTAVRLSVSALNKFEQTQTAFVPCQLIKYTTM